jgi:hypothetical protein
MGLIRGLLWQSMVLTDFVIRDLEEDKLSRSEGIEETQRHRSYHRTEKANTRNQNKNKVPVPKGDTFAT